MVQSKIQKKVGRRGAKLLKDSEADNNASVNAPTPALASDSLPTSTPAKGFDQYKISWDKHKIRWTCDFNGFHFYGDWRMTRIEGDKGEASQVAYAIDIRAKISHTGQTIIVDTIPYLVDPRENMQSLNRDICARLSKWRSDNEDPTAEHISDMRKRAEQPLLRVRRLETLDAIINALAALRDKATYHGGTHTTELAKDHEDDPSIRLRIEVTAQAIALKGRAPALGATIRASTGSSSSAVASFVASGDVSTLISRLKQSVDKAEKRKIRAQLRKLGVKGGSRALTVSVEPAAEDVSTPDDSDDDNDSNDTENNEDE